MIQLYTSNYCPYCKKVEAYLKEQGFEYERLNVGENTAYRDAVVKLGGKMQIPFLVDQERNVSLYESEDIIAYLKEQYEKRTQT